MRRQRYEPAAKTSRESIRIVRRRSGVGPRLVVIWGRTMHAAALLFALVLGADPHVVELPTVTVAFLEVEHVYDLNGVRLFDQILARDWEATGYAEIREYRITKKPGDYPRKVGDLYVVPWGLGTQGRRVQSAELVETWHQCDSEVVERKRWPSDCRRPLFPEPRPTPAPEPDDSDPLPPAPPEATP